MFKYLEIFYFHLFHNAYSFRNGKICSSMRNRGGEGRRGRGVPYHHYLPCICCGPPIFSSCPLHRGRGELYLWLSRPHGGREEGGLGRLQFLGNRDCDLSAEFEYLIHARECYVLRELRSVVTCCKFLWP